MALRWWERWGPAAGVVAVALMVISFVVAGSSPDTGDSDAKIASYLGDHSDQVRNIVGFFIFLAGILFLLVFFAALRSRLVEREAGLGRLGFFAFGAGVASAVFWAASVAVFVSPLVAANDTGKFNRDPDLYRLTQVLGYELWIAAVVVAALVVWATAAVALRTGFLPRWHAWVSALVGIICLFAIFFIPAFVFWGWIVVTAALLVWPRRAAVATGAARTGRIASRRRQGAARFT
jgi:hypothetical protein